MLAVCQLFLGYLPTHAVCLLIHAALLWPATVLLRHRVATRVMFLYHAVLLSTHIVLVFTHVVLLFTY
jgi:hypothetical protein